MAIRLGWLAAIGAFALALGRLARLLSVEPGTRSWLPVLAMVIVVSAAITAAALATGARWWLLIPLVAVGGALAVARLAAGSTMAFGIVPGEETLGAVREEMQIAVELVRFGSAPVVAATGLVAALAGLFWLLGAATAVGAVKRRPLLMTIPVIGFYLILATLDRRPPEWWWPAAMAACVGACLLAAADRKAAGRVRSIRTGNVIASRGKLLPLLSVAVVAIAAGGAARAFAATVPESGLVSWRSSTGFGGGLFGGISYNLFADMQQDLAGLSPEILFVARVSDSPLPPSELYWKLITLDTYDGNFWLPANLDVVRPQTEADWEAPEFAFTGPTVRVESVVRIEALRQNFVPVLYSPRSLTTENELLAASYRTREDSSVKFDARTWSGLQYRVISDIPVIDLSVLASSGGSLSPIFANAQEAGAFPITPADTQVPLAPSRVREIYTDLPDDFPIEVEELARLVTEQTTTNFERAMVLETFFRTSGGFRYDAAASSGHSSLDLASWLIDGDSLNYRTGYCEQFASAMAVMARTLNIPSRVVFGFAPGERVTQSDGAEVIVVRALHAHAWVELYMAGQGWVRFDPTPRGDGVNPPTANQIGFDPTLFLPAPIDPVPGSGSVVPGELPEDEFFEPGSDPTVGLPTLPGTDLTTLILVVLVAIVVIGAIPTAKAVRRSARLSRLGAGDVGAGWSELTDRLTDLGYRFGWSQTPYEVAGAVDRALLPLASRLAADVYGGRNITDGREVYRQAEEALRQRHQGWRWWTSWFQPRSLFNQPRRLFNQPRSLFKKSDGVA